MLFSPCHLMALLRHLVLFLALLATSSTSFAAATLVAVASNFSTPAREIAAVFAEKTGHRAMISSSSSGKLYAQIAQGAPFDLFLSADKAHAEKLLAAGKAVAGSNFTYAIGQLALYSKEPHLVDANGEILKNTERINKVAIANPKLAPYGLAAIETMKQLGVYESLNSKLVLGENIAQTFQFVYSGNAEVGFVALSQLKALKPVSERTEGAWWIVPEHLYTPIAQDAVLLRHGENNTAAMAFLEFLTSPAAVEIIHHYGYITSEDASTDR